jgi:hypothetical protein
MIFNFTLSPIILLALLPSMAMATESEKQMQTVSAVNMTLPIHQKKKLHPELTDPVLGDQAQIVEWAWTPQYAKRFGLTPQPDGLKDGPLWLIGVKIQREQNRQWQRYTCHVIGVMDNKLPIITPPGERFIYPHLLNDMPGNLPQNELTAYAVEQRKYAPGFLTWYKKPANKRQETHPENGDGMSKYITYVRTFTATLSYFEANVGCAYLGDPSILRTELRFPTRIDDKDDKDSKIGAVFEPSAIRFDLPDSLMRRVYPYIVEADDWTSCLMTRLEGRRYGLTIHSLQTKRFGNICDLVKSPR